MRALTCLFRLTTLLVCVLTFGTAAAQNDAQNLLDALPVLTPVDRWGSGTPRDVEWTTDYLAVASTAGVYLFDPADLNAPPRVIGPFDNMPVHIAADPTDANRLALQAGRTTTLWDVAANHPLHEWITGSTPLSEMMFSADGRRLLTPNGTRVFVWDTRSGALVQTFGDEAAPVRLSALSPDGTLLFTSGVESALALWDVDSGALLRDQFRFSADLGMTANRAVAFAIDGSAVMASDGDGNLRVWPLANSDDVLEYARPYMGDPNTPTVNRAQFVDGGRLLTAETSYSGGLRLWQVDSDITEVATFDPAGYGSASRFALSPDRTQAVAVVRYQTGEFVDVFELDSLLPGARVGDFRNVTGFTLSDDGTLLLTEGLGDPILLNTADGSVNRRLEAGADFVTGSAMRADNAFVAACTGENAMSYDPIVAGWSLRESSTPFTLLDKFAFVSGGICERTFIAADGTVGFVSYDGVYVETAFGEFERALAADSGGRTYSAFAGDIGLLGSAATGVTVFRTEDPAGSAASYDLPWTASYTETIRRFPVAVSQDGALVARLSGEAIEQFDVYGMGTESAALLATLAADAPVTALALSADGRHVTSGHDDGVVLLWDVRAQAPVARLVGGVGALTTLAFSPDGDRLYALGEGSVITVWALDSQP